MRIQPVLNGFVVQCGCQTVVFNDVDIMLSEIRSYYKDPKGTETRFFERKVNDMTEVVPCAPTPECASEAALQRPRRAEPAISSARFVLCARCDKLT